MIFCYIEHHFQFPGVNPHHSTTCIYTTANFASVSSTKSKLWTQDKDQHTDKTKTYPRFLEGRINFVQTPTRIASLS